MGHIMRGVLFTALLFTFGCNDGMKEYVIDAGKHSSTSKVATFSGSTLDFVARFEKSAIYTTDAESNQADINKLYGFSDCTSHHHTHSARVGWRWFDDEVQVLAYTYADGTRDWELLGSVEIERNTRFKIHSVGDTYEFEFDGTTTVMDRGCDGGGGVKYKLWPYFGGDETAPHDVHIWLGDS